VIREPVSPRDLI